MRYPAPLLALALAAAPAAAQLSAPETAVLPRVIDAACVDVVPERTGCETAVLLRSETDGIAADLVILSHPMDGPPEALAVARGIAFDSGMAGQRAALEDGGGGSLRVRSGQDDTGRSPWGQTLTLAWRDGALRAAGVTYDGWDRIDGAAARCDVNLLSGGWERSYAPAGGAPEVERGKGAALAAAASDWTLDTALPEACDPVLDRLGK